MAEQDYIVIFYLCANLSKIFAFFIRIASGEKVMLFKLLALSSLVFLTACSNGFFNKTGNADRSNASFAGGYTKKSPLVPVNTIASSNNLCVDNFNFLRQARSNDYPKYSENYIKIGSGYTFLNVNKNIMGKDARDVYAMSLETKLDKLCSRVKYTSYQIVIDKISELDSI